MNEKNIHRSKESDSPIGLSNVKNFTANDMEKLFTALGQKLDERSENSGRYEIYIVGGSAMMLSIGIKRTTTDIDVVINKNVQLIHDCAVEISEETGIVRGWCNDLVTCSNSYTPAIITYSSLYKAYGRLDVYVPDAELLLCMKLISFRTIDIKDIAFLIDYIESNRSTIKMDDINTWFNQYYEKFERKLKFKKNAIQFIKENFK